MCALLGQPHIALAAAFKRWKGCTQADAEYCGCRADEQDRAGSCCEGRKEGVREWRNQRTWGVDP